MNTVVASRNDKCFEVKVSSCTDRESETKLSGVRGGQSDTEIDIHTERECVHSWPYPVGCGLRKASFGVTCVGGVR